MRWERGRFLPPFHRNIDTSIKSTQKVLASTGLREKAKLRDPSPKLVHRPIKAALTLNTAK